MRVIVQRVLGLIEFHCRINNLSTKYRDNLELVLKDITINVQPGEKVRENEWN